MTWTGSVKGRFPFRVGAPSYVIPADIMPNVRLLSDVVDDIEILIFESDAIAPLPDETTIDALRAQAQTAALTYTVHLPLDANIGAHEESERRAAVQKHVRVIARTARLEPHAFILHCPAPEERHRPTVQAAWHASLAQSARELCDAGIDLRHICIETLDYPLQEIDAVIQAFEFSVCLDVGHVLLHHYALAPLIERYMARARVLHLHGVHDGKDHRAISALDPAVRSMIRSALHEPIEPARVLTLEVFHADRLKESLNVLEGWVES